MENKKSSITHIRNWVRTNGEMSQDGKSITYSCAELEAVIREAEAMHKEEIAKSYFEGENRKWNSVNGYEYYNEKFGGDNE